MKLFGEKERGEVAEPDAQSLMSADILLAMEKAKYSSSFQRYCERVFFPLVTFGYTILVVGDRIYLQTGYVNISITGDREDWNRTLNLFYVPAKLYINFVFRYLAAEIAFLVVMWTVCILLLVLGCRRKKKMENELVRLRELVVKVKRRRKEKEISAKKTSTCCPCDHMVTVSEEELRRVAQKTKDVCNDRINGGWI